MFRERALLYAPDPEPFMKLVSPLGKVAWSAMVTPRENQNSRTLEWSVGLVVREEECAPLLEVFSRLIAERSAKEPHFNADPARLGYPLKPSFSKDAAGNRIPEPGLWVISAKRKVEVNTRAGIRRNTPPVIYDSQGMVVTSQILNVPSGSTGKVIVEAFCYDNAGNRGVALDFIGFQIASVAEDMPDLAPIEGGWTAGNTQPTSTITSPTPSAHPPLPGVAAPVPAGAPQQPVAQPQPQAPAPATPAQQFISGPQPQFQSPWPQDQAQPPAPVQPQPPAQQPPSVLDLLRRAG